MCPFWHKGLDKEILWTWRISMKADSKYTLIKTAPKIVFFKWNSTNGPYIPIPSVIHCHTTVPVFVKCPLDQLVTAECLGEPC